ncbi:hypothetical protein OG607_11245 [Streptomyces sp. NBC_01537]|uniref:hypothetical protein n=1 Tax=Streptomyces sp. NBC_01537 TaxID=2903896 RepID=UPI00386AC48F
MKALRITIGTAGVAAMALGAVLLTDPQVKKPLDVLVWLLGAVLLHDGVLVPAILAAGAVLSPRLRRATRGALIIAACLTAVALPTLLRPGRPTNASVLPLDYGRNLVIALGTVAVLAVTWHVVRRFLRHRPTADGADEPEPEPGTGPAAGAPANPPTRIGPSAPGTPSPGPDAAHGPPAPEDPPRTDRQ